MRRQRHVETETCGDRDTWGQRHVETETCGDRDIWRQRHVGTETCDDRYMWERDMWGQRHVWIDISGGRHRCGFHRQRQLPKGTETGGRHMGTENGRDEGAVDT